MYLEKIIKPLNKKYKKIPVNGISFDSRNLKKGNIFFAIQGNKTSGLKYIDSAITKGASAIVSNNKINHKDTKIPFIIVKDVRKKLSEASSNLYKKKPKNIIAVTGTNGKSSVANFFYQILSFSKMSAASIGTLGIQSKKYNKKMNLTSIDSPSLHKNLQILSDKKINYVILEASSHGLEQKRLDSLNIKTAIFTNLSHDHLDYHKNMKSYFKAKQHLFINLIKKKSTVVTDEENKEFKKIKSIIKKRNLKKLTIGKKSGNIKIINCQYNGKEQIIELLINLKIIKLRVSLIGFFQIKNLLMAALAANSCGIKLTTIFKKIHKIKSVPGRLECVATLNNNSNIILDFAHSPDALEQSLIAIQTQFNKKIVIVFGCGGERDKKKRIKMGQIAKKYCRKIFITDDNPRNENPKKIRNEIIKGCGNLASNIGNRKKAIASAIKELKANELLLVAGKGHETTQDYGSRIFHFSDRQQIKNVIKKKKLIFNKNYIPHKILKNTFNHTIKNINYEGASINTKSIKKNNIFFAIKGKNNDGHNFVKEAIRKGAIKAVVNRNIKGVSNNKIIKVKNTFSSLNSFAFNTRKYSSSTIIGVTGSVGKTTVKNLLNHILIFFGKVHCSPHSYNNKFGVPISISNLKNSTKYGIFEIGMDKKGEIKNLSSLVKPQIGIITNISEAHLKNFRSIKDIAKAKSEIIENISENGSLVLNKDSIFFDFLSRKAKKRGINVISFGVKNKSDIFLLSKKRVKNLLKIKVKVKNENFYFNIKNFNNSFIKNILICIATAHILNLNLNKIKNSFSYFKIPEGRGDIKLVTKFNKKFKLIDESYNANPLSMKSAINNMSNYYTKKKEKKVAFLGDMLELGIRSKKLHRELAPLINKSNINKVFIYGKHIKETFYLLSKNKKGKIFKNLEEAYVHFRKIIRNNDLLMVKGSNATGLNHFVKNIKKGKNSAI